MRLTIPLLLLAAFSLVPFPSSEFQGIPGPRGPRGYRGLAGPPGPRGYKGAPGGGLPLTAKDGNGTLIFQAGTSVVCPSAIPGPGAAAPQITCPAGLYLPLQLVSAGDNGVLSVAFNLSIAGTAPVAPFVARKGSQIPHLAPGYTVKNGQWIAK